MLLGRGSSRKPVQKFMQQLQEPLRHDRACRGCRICNRAFSVPTPANDTLGACPETAAPGQRLGHALGCAGAIAKITVNTVAPSINAYFPNLLRSQTNKKFGHRLGLATVVDVGDHNGGCSMQSS